MEENNLLFPTLVLLPILFLILNHFKALYSLKSSPLPPGPRPWPILGNILQLGKNPHIAITNLAQSYGPLISLKLGSQLVIVGSSKAAAIEILKTNDRILSGRFVPHVSPAKSLERNNFSIGWVLECNEKWKHLRTICRTELFSGKVIESQALVREKKAMEMVEFIGTMEGKVVKIRDIVVASVFNMLCNILVSRDLVSLQNENMGGGMNKLFREIMGVASAPNISDYYPLLGRLDLQKLQKKSVELYERCCEIWEEITKERRGRKRDDASSGQQQQDFLDVLINNGSSDDQINMLLLELLSAGTDTSSSAIEWTMAELIKNPKLMKKVKEELETEINQDVPKESHLPRLTYLQACVKETLRLHPSAPFLLPRRAVDSCTVMNYTIPKNSQVLVNYWAISRDPENWEDPLVYKPERFLIGSNLDFKGSDFEFLPFGGGRRICPGLPMAAKHVPLVLATLIRFFDWSLPCGNDPEEMDMSEVYSLTMMKKEPLLLVPKVRK